jgi:ATP-dependent Clp protease ATP-binding subunit ClpC
MFERFNDRALRVVCLMVEEARTRNHETVHPEHLLLALVREGEGTAVWVLQDLDIPLGALHSRMEEAIGHGEHAPAADDPLLAAATKVVLKESLRAALDLGHDYIGSEHLLLGLIREGQSIVARVLLELGADQDRVRARVIEVLSDVVAAPAPPTPKLLDEHGREVTPMQAAVILAQLAEDLHRRRGSRG